MNLQLENTIYAEVDYADQVQALLLYRASIVVSDITEMVVW